MQTHTRPLREAGGSVGVCACNLSIQETEAGLLGVQGQPRLLSEPLLFFKESRW